MMELKKPTRIMLHIATGPVLSMEMATSTLVDIAQIPSSNPVGALASPPRNIATTAIDAAAMATSANSGRPETSSQPSHIRFGTPG